MNKHKIVLASLVVVFAGLFLSYNSAEAATCTKTWNGKSYSYNYGSSGSTGTFTFTNWANTQYNISIHVVGNVKVCLNQTDFNNMMSWSYNSDASAFWSKNLDNWSRTLSCGNTHTYSRVHVPVNGECGPADGATYTSAPDTGLCDVGTASSVNVNQSTYTWSCAGQYGGTTAQCSADKGNNGGTNNTGENNNGGGQNTGTPLSGAVCQIASGSYSLVNVGSTVDLQAVYQGGDGNYTYSWSNVTNSSAGTAQVTRESVGTVSSSVSITSDGVTQTGNCPPIIFAYIPKITVTPPITVNTCKLDWDTTGLPTTNAECQVFSDGALTSYEKGDDVKPGAKYQVRCTYTPEGSTTSTTTSSEIRACVKNPSLIEI